MGYLITVFIALPLLAFFSSLFFKNKQERQIVTVVELVTLGLLLMSVLFAVVWIIQGGTTISQELVTVYRTEGFAFVFQFYYDSITVVFSLVGTLLFFLVARFSRFYMHRDAGFRRFFNTLLFFITGYNLIVFSGNFETLFIGWEFIGISSFLLIAFYRNRYLPVKNAMKTLSVYRVSDIALILAMWMMHHITHKNILFTELADAGTMAAVTGYLNMGLFIAAMIVVAAAIKSAQLPFTTWLPRAMEGPTSSSAIFYGSLSVHIGVFLLLRTYPFWSDMTGVKAAVISIGAATAVIATLVARVQPTVKTQIAYSSAAQIGLIFIEVALGWHILALIHFAGNAFLRTYQLLVSPSVLNYLIHHQYFHYKESKNKGANKIANTLYMLGVKEWNLDTLLFRYAWAPFKWIGHQLRFIETKAGKIVVAVLMAVAVYATCCSSSFLRLPGQAMPLISLLLALLLILFSFTTRGSAITAWLFLAAAHIFILSGILSNIEEVKWEQAIMYASGIFIGTVTGLVCLQHTQSVDKDILLNRHHGYIYEQENTALIFFLSALSMLGFPITAAFIGVDVFFTHIKTGQAGLVTLIAISFLFLELAAIRIYCRIYLGLHKKLNHPVAYRSS